MSDHDEDAHLRETRIDGSLVYAGDFLQVERDAVRLPNGKRGSREFIRHPGAVVILPLLDDGKVVLERQFRYPPNRVFVEFPAGKIDPGESHLDCAKRELREETGYRASTWQHLCTIHNAIGYSDEHLELFLAQDLTPGPHALDEEEFVELISVAPQELLEWVREGRVTDVKTVIGAFWLEKILQGQWRV